MIHRLVVTVLVTSSLVAVWLEHQTILVDAFLTPSSSSSSSWRTPPSIYQTTETTTRPVVSSLLKFQQEQEQQGAWTTRYKNTRLFASTSQYNTDTLYAILNIDPSDYPQRYMIDKKVIRKAYKRMALQYHPDRVVNQHSTPEEKKYANDVFAQINAAYDLLMTTKQAQSSPSGPTQTTSSTASARTTASPSQTSTSTGRSGFNYHSATGNAGAYSPRHRRSSYYTRNNNGATTGYHGDYTQASPNGGGQQYNYAYSSTVGSNPTSDWWRTSINATEAIDDDEDEVAVHYRPNKTATSTAFASGTSARYRPEFNYHSAAATATTGVDSKSPPRANGNSGRNHQRRRQQQQQQQRRPRQEGFPSYHSSVDRTGDDTDSSNNNNNNMDPSSYYNYMTDPTTTTSENNDPSSYYSTTDPAITDTNDQVMMDPSYYDSIQDPATMDNIGDHYEYNNNNNSEDDNVLEEEYSHHPLETPAVVGEYNDGGYEEYEEDVETMDKDDIIIDTYSTVVDPYEGYESTKQSSSDWWRTMGDVDDDTSAQQHPPSPGRYAQATARHGNGQWWQTSIMDEEEEEEEGLFGDEIMEDIEGLHEEQLEEDYNDEMTFNSMNANHGGDYVTQSSLPLPTPPPSPPPRRPHQASTTTSSTASSNFYQSWSNPKAVEDSTDKWWQTTETGAPHEKTESFFNNANNKTSSSAFGTSTSAADQKWWSVYLPKSEVTAATAKNFDEFLELIVEGYNSTLNDARFNTLLHNGTLEQVIEEMDHTELVVQQLSAKQTSVVYELQQVRSDQQIANNRPARVMLAQKFEKLTSRSQGLSDCVSKANSRLMSLQQVFWKLMLRAEQEEEEKRRQQIQEQQEELQRRRDRHIQPQQTFGRTTTTSSSSFPQPSTSSPSSSSSFTSSPSGTTGNGGIGSNNVAKRATIPYKPTPNYRRTSSVGGIRMTASDSTYSPSSSSAKDIFTRRDQAAGGFGTREGAGGAGIGNRVTGTHSNSNGARAPTTATKGRRSVIPRFARRTTNRPPVSRTPTTGVSLDIDAEDTSGTTPHTSPPKDVWRHRDHGSFYDRYRPHSNRSASSSSSPLSDFANPDIDSIIDYSDFSAWDQARRLAIVEEGLQALLKKGTEGGLHKMYRKIFRQMLKHAFGIKRGYALVLTDDFIETTPVISAHTLYRAPQDGITQRILSQCTTPELGLYLGYLILSADDP